MNKYRLASFRIAMISTGLLATSLIAPSVAGATTIEPNCSDVMILGARGTDEPMESGAWRGFGESAGLAALHLHDEIKRIDSNITISHTGIEYAARGATPTNFANFISAGGFDGSVKEGVADTISVLHSTMDACPKTQVVMMGYSQGAEVMHEAANSYFGMHSERSVNLAKVWLISDPTTWHVGVQDSPGGASYFDETGYQFNPDGKGLISLMANNDWSPRDVGGLFHSFTKDKIVEVCHTNDTICNTTNTSTISWDEAEEIAAQLSLTELSVNKVHGSIYKDVVSTIHDAPTRHNAIDIVNMVSSARVANEVPKMVSTWDTSLPGCSVITVPINGYVNANVSWGDNSSSPMANAYPSHQYSSTDLGLKTVTVSGTFTGWGGFNKEWSSNCIISVESWQDTGTTDLSYGFAQAENLRRIAEIPSGVTTMSNMLKFTSSFIGDINNWDTSKVTDMSRLFWGSNFNGSLNRWDTSSVINMNGTFGFKNDSSLIDVANWNTANVQDMISTFTHSNFNGDISGWNTSKVMDMSYMFYGSSFNQDISSWSVPIVTLHEDFATNLASNYYPNFIN